MKFIAEITYYNYILDQFETQKEIFEDKEAKERNLIYQHLICKYGKEAQIDLKEEL